MKALRAFGWITLILFVIFGVAWLRNLPEYPAEKSASARRLQPGPHAVGMKTVTFVDSSRSIPAREDDPGADERTLTCNLWWPVDDAGPHPLIVYSHGFMSNRSEGAYLNEHLASHGYVVIAPDYPRSSFGVPGGPDVSDVVNQPADLSFLIDSVAGWDRSERPFRGEIDRERIGAVGLSLGGLTTTLSTYHPRFRDPRIRAAISIAGPISPFLPSFFESGEVPFLMIGGTIDAMIDFDSNAALVPLWIGNAGLLSIAGASHTGFSGMADPAMRFFSNPDNLGCRAIMSSLDAPELEKGGGVPWSLGTKEEGIAPPDAMTIPCQSLPLPVAMNPARQHWITKLAATAFFESHFAEDPEERARSRRYLTSELPGDFDEARYEASLRS